MYTQYSLPSDGTTGPFPISFNYLDGSTISVTRYDLDGVSNPLPLTFTFAGTVSDDKPSGSSINLSAAVASGYVLTIVKTIDMDTPALVWNQGAEITQKNLRKTTRNLMEMAQTAWDLGKKALTPLAELTDFVAAAGASAYNAGVYAAAALVSKTEAAASALEALGYRNTTLTYKNDAAASAALAQIATVPTNLTFASGAGPRILGDFSTVTHSNRLAFQTNVANGTTSLGVIANGTGNLSQFLMHNSSDAGNAGRLTFGSSSTNAFIRADGLGTGAALPLTFQTNGSVERMRIDQSGDVTLGGASKGTNLFLYQTSGSDYAKLASNAGGDVALTLGTTTPFEAWRITAAGNLCEYFPNPVPLNTAQTLAVNHIKSRIITCQPAAAFNLTLPTGTLLEGLATGMAVNTGVYFTVIVTAAFAVTLVVAAGVTNVGSLVCSANSSANFFLRKTAANTFVIYRV